MSNLKYRIALIIALIAVSFYWLLPREVTVKRRGADGILRDTTMTQVPLRRGLDLQGGTYLALEVDQSKQRLDAAATKEAIERALKTVRTRIEGIGVSETIVQQSGDDRIVVQIPGQQDPERARSLVEEQAFLEFKITDRTGALERSLARIDQAIRASGVVVADTALTGDSRPTGALSGILRQADSAVKGDTARAGAAAAADSTKPTTGGPFSGIVRVGGIPGEFVVQSKDWAAMRRYVEMPAVQAALPPGKQLLIGRDSSVQGADVYRTIYVVDERAIIKGDALTDARPTQSPSDGTVVEFKLNNSGGRRFRAETGKNIGNNMAIVLDGIVMGQPPVIQSAIGTSGQITMRGQGLVAAEDLALVLRAGALPVPLVVAEVQQIGASLGEDSIRKGMQAGLIAIVLVILIMVIYYRFSGMLAVGALALYVLFTLATLAAFDAVLTLPGLAGFVLSIGIAVDANVLIFERIREEMALGKTIRTSIDEGFRHAMPAIIDSNVSTILTATVLYQFGTGPVKGFAVTLIAGIVASLVTSIFVTRTFYLIWLNRNSGAQTLSI